MTIPTDPKSLATSTTTSADTTATPSRPTHLRRALGYAATLSGVACIVAAGVCFRGEEPSGARSAVGLASLGASGACLVAGFRFLKDEGSSG